VEKKNIAFLTTLSIDLVVFNTKIIYSNYYCKFVLKKKRNFLANRSNGVNVYGDIHSKICMHKY